jgi:hypothetical protein
LPLGQSNVKIVPKGLLPDALRLPPWDWTIARQMNGEYLRHFDGALISYRAREVIIRRLPDDEPRRDQVACELCMSERARCSGAWKMKPRPAAYGMPK